MDLSGEMLIVLFVFIFCLFFVDFSSTVGHYADCIYFRRSLPPSLLPVTHSLPVHFLFFGK